MKKSIKISTLIFLLIANLLVIKINTVYAQNHITIKHCEINSEDINSNTLEKDIKIFTDTITGWDRDPIPGITVTVKGTNRMTRTDFEGAYSIQADDNDVLLFSFISIIDTRAFKVSELCNRRVILVGENGIFELVAIKYCTPKLHLSAASQYMFDLPITDDKMTYRYIHISNRKI